jgi:hypothetical protein
MRRGRLKIRSGRREGKKKGTTENERREGKWG